MSTPFVEVKYDETQLRRIQKMLRDVPRGMATVMPRAINRTTTSAKVQIGREIAAEVVLTQATVKKNILQTKASRDRWVGELHISPRRIPLINFKATHLKKGGVSYQIERAGGRQKIAGAFKATMGSGHEGVFIRKYYYQDLYRASGQSVRRMPIRELRGPSLGVVFDESPSIVNSVMSQTGRTLEKNVDSQAEYLLNKWKGAA
jgi:hypothetical protein